MITTFKELRLEYYHHYAATNRSHAADQCRWDYMTYPNNPDKPFQDYINRLQQVYEEQTETKLPSIFSSGFPHEKLKAFALKIARTFEGQVYGLANNQIWHIPKLK